MFCKESITDRICGGAFYVRRWLVTNHRPVVLLFQKQQLDVVVRQVSINLSLSAPKRKTVFLRGWMSQLSDLGETRSVDLCTLRLSKASYIHASIFAFQPLTCNVDGDFPLDRWETQKLCKQHNPPYIQILIYLYSYCLWVGVFGLDVLHMEVCLWDGFKNQNKQKENLHKILDIFLPCLVSENGTTISTFTFAQDQF